MSIETAPTILVVDDEWMNRELMEALLQSVGYRVLLAHNAERGWEMAQTHQPELVLVDVRLRDETDGYELCSRLKTDPATSQLRVAMLTAMESEADRQAAVQAGADEFISRMLEAPALLERIEALLRGDN